MMNIFSTPPPNDRVKAVWLIKDGIICEYPHVLAFLASMMANCGKFVCV